MERSLSNRPACPVGGGEAGQPSSGKDMLSDHLQQWLGVLCDSYKNEREEDLYRS